MLVRRRLMVLPLAVLGACGDATSPVAGDLLFNRQRWADRAIVSYDFELTTTNEWFPPTTYTVSVRNGVVTRQVNKATGVEMPLGAHSQQLSIDGLFQRAIDLREEAENDAKLEFQVLFDPVLNYLRFLSADNTGWADDSYSYSASNLIRK